MSYFSGWARYTYIRSTLRCTRPVDNIIYSLWIHGLLCNTVTRNCVIVIRVKWLEIAYLVQVDSEVHRCWHMLYCGWEGCCHAMSTSLHTPSSRAQMRFCSVGQSCEHAHERHYNWDSLTYDDNHGPAENWHTSYVLGQCTQAMHNVLTGCHFIQWQRRNTWEKHDCLTYMRLSTPPQDHINNQHTLHASCWQADTFCNWKKKVIDSIGFYTAYGEL